MAYSTVVSKIENSLFREGKSASFQLQSVLNAWTLSQKDPFVKSLHARDFKLFLCRGDEKEIEACLKAVANWFVLNSFQKPSHVMGISSKPSHVLPLVFHSPLVSLARCR